MRHNCEEKIGRRWRYYPWTHRKDSGIIKWKQLYEWFEGFSRCWISTQWTFPRYQSTSVFPNFQNPGGMLSRSMGMPSRNDKPPSIGDTHGISGNVFANPTASSSAPYSQESNPSISNVSEPIHSSPTGKNENQTPVQDQRCQSGPSARNSFIPGEEEFSKNDGSDQHRLQISDPHFDKFPNPATFAGWKVRFKTEVCTCSQFLTEALLWIKEVEMVDSVDDLKSSCSARGIRMPDFALQVHSGRSLIDPSLQDNDISPDGFFKYIYHVGCAISLLSIINSGLIPGGQILSNRNSNARCWSARCEDCFSTEQNHHNSHFKRRVSLEEQKAKKEDRFFRGRQIAYLIYEYFRVTGANDSVENYADLFTIVLLNDDIQEFNSKWDGILLSMTNIPSVDILEGLYKLRKRESEKLKDRIGTVQFGDPSEESRTWLSQIEDNSEKKYRAEFTN